MNGLMQGKRGLIMGLANDRSLAWGIARAVADQGGELAFSYQGEALEKRVRPLAAELGSDRQPYARKLQRLADRARKTKSVDQDRAKIYGEMLATCAACHTVRRAP